MLLLVNIFFPRSPLQKFLNDVSIQLMIFCFQPTKPDKTRRDPTRPDQTSKNSHTRRCMAAAIPGEFWSRLSGLSGAVALRSHVVGSVVDGGIEPWPLNGQVPGNAKTRAWQKNHGGVFGPRHKMKWILSHLGPAQLSIPLHSWMQLWQ